MLAIALIVRIDVAIKEKLSNKNNLLTIALLAFILVLTFFKSYGLIDFDKFEGENILVAENKSVANCLTVLKLKDNLTFRERSVCFGVTETTGNYRLRNDTIFFDKTNRNKEEFYKFAIVKSSENIEILNLYKNLKDIARTYSLYITKNELNKLKEKPQQIVRNILK